ncbi:MULTISPECIES: hypothetical protein [Chryseobacterium]|uniref:hypothetical protein n=1 Tax=Chryseobacterium sp. R2A-55 TaxID=2744445 RepID=UPI001F444B68|nr:hypothetical protein [Chryseobacterium sp. R2A-55]
MRNNDNNISEINEHFEKFGYEYVLDANDLLIREINKAEHPIDLIFDDSRELSRFIDDVLRKTSRQVYYISSFEIEDKTIFYYKEIDECIAYGITPLTEKNEKCLYDDVTYLVDLRRLSSCSIKQLDELFQRLFEDDKLFGGVPIVFISNSLGDINGYIVSP